MTSSPVDVSKLEAALEKGTPTPWGLDPDRVGGFDLVDEDGQYIADRLGAIDKDNAELILAAVNHLPAFVALVRAVEALADEWERTESGFGRYPEESAYNDGRTHQAEHCADALRSAVGAALNPQETGR